MYQTLNRFYTRGLQKFIGPFGLILKLRDVECAGPFCFEKIEKKVRNIDIEFRKYKKKTEKYKRKINILDILKKQHLCRSIID